MKAYPLTPLYGEIGHLLDTGNLKPAAGGGFVVENGFDERGEIHSAGQHADAIQANGAAVEGDHLKRVAGTQIQQLIAAFAEFVSAHNLTWCMKRRISAALRTI
jgi:hypothetical protein